MNDGERRGIALDENLSHTASLASDGSLVIEPYYEGQDAARLTPDEAYRLYVLLREFFEVQNV